MLRGQSVQRWPVRELRTGWLGALHFLIRVDGTIERCAIKRDVAAIQSPSGRTTLQQL